MVHDEDGIYKKESSVRMKSASNPELEPFLEIVESLKEIQAALTKINTGLDETFKNRQSAFAISPENVDLRHDNFEGEVRAVKDAIHNMETKLDGIKTAFDKNSDSPAQIQASIDNLMSVLRESITTSIADKFIELKQEIKSHTEEIRGAAAGNDSSHSSDTLRRAETIERICQDILGKLGEPATAGTQARIQEEIEAVKKSQEKLSELTSNIQEKLGNNHNGILQKLTDENASLRGLFESILREFKDSLQGKLYEIGVISGKMDELSSQNASQARAAHEYCDKFNKTLEETLSNTLNDIENSVNGALDKIRDQFGAVETRLGKVDAVLADQFGEAKKQQDNFNNIFQRLGHIDGILDELVNARQREMEELRKSETDASGRAADSDKAKVLLEQQLENKINDLQSRDRENDKLKDELASLKKLNQGMSEQLGSLKKQYEEQSRIFQDKEKEFSPALRSLEKWRDRARPYENVRNALIKCGLFAGFIRKHGIDRDGDDGLFACMRGIGESQDFLNELYLEATEHKKNNPLALAPDERNVYTALNEIYRKIWQIDFDVFTQPGNQDMADEFHKVKFDKKESLHMQDPREQQRQYAQELYVPILRNRDGVIWRTAQVRAGND